MIRFFVVSTLEDQLPEDMMSEDVWHHYSCSHLDSEFSKQRPDIFRAAERLSLH